MNPSKLKYKPRVFDILEYNDGFVYCSVTDERIPLHLLLYWNVERQEPYKDAHASLKRHKELLQ